MKIHSKTRIPQEEVLSEIMKYDLIDKPEDQELNELVEIAAAICDTPMAIITICDGDHQHFIAKKGIEINSVSAKDSFCIQTLECENSIFTVNDTLTDERFKNNIYVTGQPYIRYYIGAPLVTPRGIKIGTICLLDTKERGLGADKKHGIELIAKKIIRHLEQKKLLIEQNKQIEFDQKRLRFLTDNVPGAIFQLDYSHDREEYNFSFISAGISELHPALKPKRLKDDPFLLSDLVHPEDKECFIESITTASRELVPWVKEFRLVNNHGSKWIRGIAVPRQYKKITEWYGVFENIDYLKEYQLTLEGIAFDISHGLRKPVTNLLGLIDIFDKDKMSQEDTENFNSYVKEVSVELEKFTKELNQTYYKKRTDFQEMVAKSKRLQS